MNIAETKRKCIHLGCADACRFELSNMVLPYTKQRHSFKHVDKKAWKNSLCDNCQWRAKTITCDCGFNLCNRKESPHKGCRIN